MSTQVCPICASTIPAAAAVCPVCGAALEPASGAGPARREHVLEVGTRLNGGAFSIGRVLGQGGFGITYLGADLRRRLAVAIKEFFPAGSTRQGLTVLPPATFSHADYQTAIQRFLDEGQVLTRFHHPNIVDVYSVFQENGTAYMAMEYLRGKTLLQRLAEHGEPLPEVELLSIARALVSALEVIHDAGLLHRDIKPENVILAEDPQLGRPRPVLIDFGATREFASGKTMRQSVLLTPGYAPLEQYAQQARRGPFTDIYALAATLYHLATGQQPPPATDRAAGIDLKPPRQLNPALSPTFERAILHGLEIPVDRRPPTAREFYQELSGASALLPTGDTLGSQPPDQPVPERAGDASPRAPAGSDLERVRQIARELRKSEIAAASVERRQQICPVCRSAAMLDPKDATIRLRCAVCRAGELRALVSWKERSRCPSCRTGELRQIPTTEIRDDTLMRCPACRVGAVVQYLRARLMLVPDYWARCDTCRANFDLHSGQDELKLVDLPNGPGLLDPGLLGQTLPRREWMRLAGRTETIYHCPVCQAEFDRYPEDGPAGTMEWVAVERRADRVPPEYRGRRLPPVDFIKLANDRPRDAGTHDCPNCGAEYDEIRPNTFTLLHGPRDPFNVLARYRGQPHERAFWQALALGSRSPRESELICPYCTAELDQHRDGGYSLTAYDRAVDPYGIGARLGRPEVRYSQADWQRIAAGAMPETEERRLRVEAEERLWQAILAGSLTVLSPDRPYPDVAASPALPSLWSVWQAVLSGDLSRLDPNRPNPHAIAPGENVILALPASRYQEYAGNFYALDAGMIWVTTVKLFYLGQQVPLSIPLADIADSLTTSWTTGYGETEDVVILDVPSRRERIVFGFAENDQYIDVAVEDLTVPLRVDADRFVELCRAIVGSQARPRRGR